MRWVFQWIFAFSAKSNPQLLLALLMPTTVNPELPQPWPDVIAPVPEHPMRRSLVTCYRWQSRLAWSIP